MKNIKQFFIIAISLFLLISCEPFLDRPPLDAVGTESYWKSAQDLENYILQFYPMFPEHGSLAYNQVARKDDRSDNLITDIANEYLNGEMTVTTQGWKNDWNEIRGINIFLANYQKCEDEFSLYKHYLGEAYFFKAWFYFNLLKQYGDLPWYSEPLYPESEELLQKARDPRTLVVDSILQCLDNAVTYLDKLDDLEEGNNRISKEFALAFKTRVSLFEATWQKYHSSTPFSTPGALPQKYFSECIDAAEELMSGDYTVGIYNTGNPDNDYYSLFGKSDMGRIDEVIFYRAYNVEDNLGHNTPLYSTIFPGRMGVTWDLVSSYLSQDGEAFPYLEVSDTAKGNAFLTSIAENCDKRLKSTIWIPGDLQITSNGLIFELPAIDKTGENFCPTGFQYKKYSNPDAPVSSGNEAETGLIIMRYAEVLLNYAEAKYELDGTVAYTELNLLRERAGMPPFQVISQSSDPNVIDYGYAITDELYEIRRERRVETALEGLREDDLKRWAAHTLFLGKRFKGYPFSETEFPDYSPPLDEFGRIDYLMEQIPSGYQFRPERDYLDDIPQSELLLNPNLSQNPGWGE